MIEIGPNLSNALTVIAITVGITIFLWGVAKMIEIGPNLSNALTVIAITVGSVGFTIFLWVLLK